MATEFALDPDTALMLRVSEGDAPSFSLLLERHRVSVVNDLDESDSADVVIVVNPNNPTGRVIPVSVLRTVATTLARKNGLLIVDEAFIDVLPEMASIASDPPPATIVLRSCGKTYGLAGLRLGFAIAEVSLAKRIRAEFGPWAVSGPALRIGKAALCDTYWLAETTARLESDQQRLDAVPELLIPMVVMGELYYGAAHSSRPQQNVAMIETFARTCVLLGIDVETAQLYGVLKAEQRTKGRPIPENDLWIAACARQHNLVLVTRDRHFEKVAGLSTEVW